MSIRIDGTNTTANPGITGGDADTGLQFGTDEVSIVTGGTERVNVDNSKLHLSATGFPTIRVTDADNNTFFDVTNSDGDIILKGDEGNSFANSAIRFNIDGAEKARIQSGGGISFNGDTAAANALDDYEEGTWTPTEKSSIFLNVSFARYIKIGSFVMCEVDITYGANSNLNDTGITLPFAMDEVFHYGNGISAWSQNGDGVKFHVSSNFAFLMRIETGSSSGNSNLTGSAMSSNRVLGTFTYRTAT